MSEQQPGYHPRIAPELTVENVLSCLSTSDWLKRALMTALNRDVVDAASDAELLARLLSARADATLATQAARNGIRGSG